jgi:uncharacterized protein
MRKTTILLLFIFCVTLESIAQVDPAPKGDLSNIPAPEGYVNDFADVLLDEEEEILENYLKTYEENTSREIAVVSVQSLHNYSDIAKLTTDLMDKWGVGQDELDNGLVVLIAPINRKMRIATGINTEDILTDQICSEVLNQQMIPFFKDGHFYEGILTGIVLLQEHWGATTAAENKFLDMIED